MTGFDLHLHDFPIGPNGVVNVQLPTTVLNQDVQKRVTQLYSIQLLYLIVSDAVNVIDSKISCVTDRNVLFNKTLFAKNYYRSADLVQDLERLVGPHLEIRLIRLHQHQYLHLTNRLKVSLQLCLSSRLAWILGLKFQTRDDRVEFCLPFGALQEWTAAFPTDLWRGNHIAHLLSLDSVLDPPTIVQCLACLKRERVAFALASLVWESDKLQPDTLFAKQLTGEQVVTGYLTRENFTLALLDGELQPFAKGPLTRVSIGFKFIETLQKGDANQGSTG